MITRMDYGAFQKLLGKRIKELREAKGLTQEEVSGLEMGVRVYQRIESGQTSATLRSLFKIAHALEIQPRELLPLIPAERDPRPKRKSI